jgi:hypothetical protein
MRLQPGRGHGGSDGDRIDIPWWIIASIHPVIVREQWASSVQCHTALWDLRSHRRKKQEGKTSWDLKQNKHFTMWLRLLPNVDLNHSQLNIKSFLFICFYFVSFSCSQLQDTYDVNEEKEEKTLPMNVKLASPATMVFVCLFVCLFKKNSNIFLSLK